LAEKQIYFEAWTYESEVNLALMGLELLGESIYYGREVGVGWHTRAKSDTYDCLVSPV